MRTRQESSRPTWNKFIYAEREPGAERVYDSA